MKRALMLTAYDRPDYLRQTLASWKSVRGFHTWPLFVFLEPSPHDREMVEIITEIEHPAVQLNINPEKYGVLHNPWVGFERVFMVENYDFVVRMEDDLIVSTDTLEYFTWASSAFRHREEIATVCAYTDAEDDSQVAHVSDGFSPWVWGTWKDRWKNIIGPTWDHDYSTFNDYPGNQAGWDWNLNTRIFPQRGLKNITPGQSRSQNIGVVGTHAIPEEFHTSPSFVQYRDRSNFFIFGE